MTEIPIRRRPESLLADVIDGAHEEMIILGENLSDREMLQQIVKEIRELRESHERILALVNEIKDKVEPTISALSESPILRMMGVK